MMVAKISGPRGPLLRGSDAFQWHWHPVKVGHMADAAKDDGGNIMTFDVFSSHGSLEAESPPAFLHFVLLCFPLLLHVFVPVMQCL